MRRLNLSTSLTVAGDATSGTISYSGLTSPTVTEIGDNPDVSVATDGVCTFAELVDASETVTVKVQDAAGYFIQGPVAITGDGSGVEYASLGINLASINSYNGNYPFSNVMANAYPWARRATSGGSGDWLQHQGSLTAAVSTDQFVTHLSDHGLGWVDGTYRIFNPDGCWIAVGYGADSPGTYFNTSPYFDVDLTPPGTNGVYVFVKGSLTNIAGPLKIVRPGLYDTAGETDTFTPEFITFMETLNAGPLRFMDWTVASSNIESDWVDRTDPDSISFSNEHGRNARVAPWERCIELANRLGKDPWFCIPPQATQDYVEQLAALVDALLDPALTAWFELGNEIWNSDSSWLEGHIWVTYLDHTKRMAVANGVANTFTLAAHGLSEDQAIHCFSTPENLALGLAFDTTPQYRMNNGSPAFIKYVDADTFQLKDAVGGAVIGVYDTQVNLRFIVDNEPGKVANRNEHYAELCVRNWDALDAALGVGRVKHIVASQSSTPSVTTGIFSALTALGAEDRADCIATAPYFNGMWMGGQIVTASGQFTPKAWSLYSGIFYWGVYASGATPTIAEIKAGTGAVASYVQTYTTSSSWSAGTAMTGVTNGTSYEIYLVRENGGAHYKMHATVTASASTTTTTITDSYANQAIRLLLNAKDTQATAHIAASGGKELIAYELGADFNIDMPTEILEWTGQFYESAEAGDAYRKAMYIRAIVPTKTLCYFADTGTNGTTGYSAPFSMANTYADTTDERFLALSSLNGQVRIRTELAVADATATTVSADPGSFPYTAHTFADAGLTYTIIGGNQEENFDTSGGTLRMVAENNVDWASSTTYGLLIFATDGYTVDTFTLTIKVGAAVFETETDALIARLSPAPDSTHKVQINTLIAALKSASVWSKLDGFYINCMASAGQITENWVSSNYDQTNNGGTFTADSGVAGNGASAYESTTFNPSTASSPNFQRNSAHLWAYSLSTAASASSIDVGSTGTAGWGMSVGRSDQANASRGFINSSTVTNYPAQANCKGMYVLTRTTSTLTTMYKDGSSIGTDTAASTVDPGNFTMAALRYNALYSDKALAGWGFGGGLTGADVSAMSSAIATYLTARGAI